MLTSMTKGVGTASYNAFKGKKEGTGKSGITSLGLAEGGVGWAVDKHNEALVKPYMKIMKTLESAIISGDIKIHDYMSNNKCEY